MLELATLKLIGFPAAVLGTVPSGATHATMSERIVFAAEESSGVTRAVEFSRSAVITVPSGKLSAR